MGAGHALAKKLITLLQGEITVAGQVGRGSTFTVSIPLRMDIAGAQPALEERGSPGAVTVVSWLYLFRLAQDMDGMGHCAEMMMPGAD